MLNIGEKKQIHSYKHNGYLHRIWQSAMVIFEDGDCIITANHKTKVIEKNGRTWNSKEPAICFFSKKEWFNAICMIKKEGVDYYVNVASPALYDEEGIKYIDYDLDVRVIDHHVKILDEKEFSRHSRLMGYSEKIISIAKRSLSNILACIKNKEVPFTEEFARNCYREFSKLMAK